VPEKFKEAVPPSGREEAKKKQASGNLCHAANKMHSSPYPSRKKLGKNNPKPREYLNLPGKGGVLARARGETVENQQENAPGEMTKNREIARKTSGTLGDSAGRAGGT